MAAGEIEVTLEERGVTLPPAAAAAAAVDDEDPAATALAISFL